MKGNNIDRAGEGFKRVVRDLETPIIYAMTIVASVIGILIWGATRSVQHENGVILQFKSAFGTEYGLLFTALVISILIANRRWKGIAVVAGAWLLLALTEMNPGSSDSPSWDEYFALGAMLSSLCLSFCVRHRLLD